MKTARAVAVCLTFTAAGCASQDAHPRNAASLSSVSPSSVSPSSVSPSSANSSSVSPSSSTSPPSSVGPPPSSASVAAPSGYPPAIYVGALTTPRYDAIGDVVLDVPLSTDIPRISVAQAYAVCGQGSPGCNPSKGPTITLALVTTPHAGQANSDGSITPTINHALTYVLTWNGVGCPMGGPAGASLEPTQSQQCTAVNYVDANTGQSVYAYEGG